MEFRKTALIGLGGAGQQIVLSVKRLFIDTFGVVPPAIKLLALDTDANQKTIQSVTSGETYRFDPDEFIHLAVKQPREFIDSDGQVGKWFVKPVPVGAIENGAGAVRQNGRLAFFANINPVLTRFDRITSALNDSRLPWLMENAKTELKASTDFKLSRKAPEIYICGSLAGGTGSGTFIDTGILMRNKMPQAVIQGFFLLDWVYRHKAFANRVHGNVYAALSELDNLQSIMYGASGFVPYTMTYADQRVEVRDCPYSLVNLIDGRNQYGENIDDVGALCDTVATAIFLSAGKMGQEVASVVDNLLAHINVQSPRIWKGKFARYSSLGVSSIYYPAPELHDWASMANALKLCQKALAEAKEEQAGDTPETDRSGLIDKEVDILINKLSLTRSNVRNKVCPFSGEIIFQVEKFEIADPDLLSDKQRGEESALEKSLIKTFEDRGRPNIDDAIKVVQEELTAVKNDASKDTMYRLCWVNSLCDQLQTWSNETASEITEKSDAMNQVRTDTENLLEIVRNSRYLPLVGGPRKSAVAKWSETVLDLFRKVKETKILEFERRFYDAILETLRPQRPEDVPGVSEVTDALDKTKERLQGEVKKASNTINRLKEKRTQVLLGNGNIVAIHGKGDKGEHGSQKIDDIFIDYAQFKKDKGIKTSEHFLMIYNENKEELFSLFSEYCLKELHYLAEFSIIDAMKAFATKGVDAYLEWQIDHLFRYSSPLWSYHSGRVNEVQAMQYDNILTLGIENPDDGKIFFEKTISKIKDRYGIKADHAYSITHDKYRVWLLNYAAALPLYFMNGLQETKERYEKEITPTYHIDRYLEMNTPDPFPVDEKENVALRVLGMAIVSGVDVIKDDYRPEGERGHKFTCDAEPIKKLNGDSITWRYFLEMYKDVKEDKDLRGILRELLKKRVKSMDQETLKTSIENHNAGLKKKLDERDFSKLTSARLTYREIKALEKFISPRGYRMNIDQYIDGK